MRSVAPFSTPIFRLRRRFGVTAGTLKGCVTAEGSNGSGPAIVARTKAQSAAVRASGPSLSMVQASAIAPWRLTRPYVGRRPVTPQYAAGVRIEPDVSEPIAHRTSPAATAAPGPELEPPLQ